MKAEPGVRMRINKRAFDQYYDVALETFGSQRKVASAASVTHALIYKIQNDRSKTHVNLATARKFEKAFKAPSDIIFTPEVLPLTGSDTHRRVAA